MNFEQIKERYPKAWEKFENFAIVDPELEADSVGYSDDYVDDINRLSLTTLSGYLFRFFDEQGIYIVIDWCNFEYRITVYFPKFDIVYPCNEENIEEYQWFKTRQEAEQAAFTKAFEILEQKK